MDKPAAESLLTLTERLAVRMFTWGAGLAVIMVAFGSIVGGLDWQTTVQLATLLLVALLPFAFPWLWLKIAPGARLVGRLLPLTLTVGIVQLYIVVFGFISQLFLSIPAGLSGMLLLAIDIVILVVPAFILERDKDIAAEPKPARFISPEQIIHISSYALVMGVLGLINYLLFFSRNRLEAQFLASGSGAHELATTVVFVTIALCLVVELFAYAGSGQIFKRHHLQNKAFWLIVVVIALLTSALLYGPWPWLFSAQPLGLEDWWYALGGAVIFAIVRDLHTIQKKHARKAVLALHQERGKPDLHKHLNKKPKKSRKA